MSNKLIDNKELMKEWNYEKNKDIETNNITCGMENKYWWKCSKCNYEWETSIYLRSKGSGCPKCAINSRALKRKKSNIEKNGSLYEKYPELIKDWNYKKNKETPNNITSTSNTKVWWKCHKCGYEWQSAVSKRTKSNHNCPCCVNQVIVKNINDLQTINPILAKEWNKKNKKRPDEVGAGSSKMAWWKCSKCDYEWQATISSRNNGNGCPLCSNKIIIKGKNDFATTNSELLKDWNYEKNIASPYTLSAGSKQIISWKCHKCSYEWETHLNSRTSKNTGCPNCSEELRISFPEKAIVFYVLKVTKNVIENYRPECLLGKEIDIYINDMQIGIEYDGSYYHKNKIRDEEKDNLCFKNGIKLYRIREFGTPILSSKSICIYREDNKDESLNVAIQDLIKKIFNKEIDVDVDRDRFEIYDLINFTEQEKNIDDPILLQEWNYEKNKNILPENVKKMSSKKVWWKCSKCNYEWEAIIYSRSKGNGCPVCANKIIIAGINDLKSLNPSLAKDWSYDKNKCDILSLGTGSGKKVWWKCQKCKYEWEATIASRNNGNGCPNCGKSKVISSRLKNKIIKTGSFASKHPEFLKLWDYSKNLKRPEEYTEKSNEKVWWKCSNNHSYNMSISNIINNYNCPYCSNRKILKGYNDFATTNPELLKEWDYEKNKLNPSEIHNASNEKIWWKCSKCKNEWQATIIKRKGGRGCPQCGKQKSVISRQQNILNTRGTLELKFPKLLKDWDYEKNDLLGIFPNKVTSGSSKRVWWKCHKCNNEWFTKICHRTSGSGCPKCSQKK